MSNKKIPTKSDTTTTTTTTKEENLSRKAKNQSTQIFDPQNEYAAVNIRWEDKIKIRIRTRKI